jgi:AcrR family transcriptional regulator
MAGERAKRLSPEDRRVQIMDSAVALIIERGLSGCTLEDVAAKAGISKPLIYKYFSKREDLLKAVLEREYKYLRGSGLDVLPKDVPFVGLIRSAIRRSLDYLYERGPIMRLLASDRSVAALVQDRDRDERSVMTRYFAEGAQRTFGASKRDAEIITILTVNAPILSARALKARGIPAAEAAEIWADFVLGGWKALEEKAREQAKAETEKTPASKP